MKNSLGNFPGLLFLPFPGLNHTPGGFNFKETEIARITRPTFLVHFGSRSNALFSRLCATFAGTNVGFSFFLKSSETLDFTGFASWR